MNIKLDEYNINGTYPSNNLFLIKKIPHVIFALKSFPLPGVGTTSPEINHPKVTVNLPGDTFAFEQPLSCQVFLDEYWKNHSELYTWFFNNVTGVHSDIMDVYSHGLLLHYNNSLKIVTLEVKFFNLHPIGINAIDLDNITVDETVFGVNFAYDKYEPTYPKLS